MKVSIPPAAADAHPAGWLAGCVGAVSPVTRLLNAAGSVGTFAMMCLICADVVGRYAFNSPIAGVTEIIQMSIVAIVFLQLPDTSRTGRITRADSLLNSLRISRPSVARAIDCVAAICGVILMGILAYGVIPSAIDDYRHARYIGTVGIFTFPDWPTKAIVGLGSVLAGLQMLLQAAQAVFAPGSELPGEAIL